MAEFDDNPFADPANINPFADPSVQAATSTPKAEEEYNPFADEPKQKDPEPIKLPPPPTKSEQKAKEKKEKQKPKSKPASKKPVASEPAIMQPEEPPPEYSPAPPKFKSTGNDEISKREEEIARREAALVDRERNIERLGSGEKPNNFPPFPKFCPSPFKPCFYINVKVEVPPSEHWKVYCLLALMIYLWVLLVINLVVSIAGAATIEQPNQGTYLTTMGVSVVYLILFAPGSFFCWFLPVYYAYKKDSSLAFMWFFFVMLFQCLSFILSAIGIPNLGACGFFNGANLFSSSNEGAVAAGAMYMIVGFLWFLGIIPAVFLLIMIHRYYRTSGGSINKAVTEGVTGAAKNDAIKGAVKSTVKAGVKTAFTDNENN